jgi:hypothetical protein
MKKNIIQNFIGIKETMARITMIKQEEEETMRMPMMMTTITEEEEGE